MESGLAASEGFFEFCLTKAGDVLLEEMNLVLGDVADFAAAAGVYWVRFKSDDRWLWSSSR